MYNAVNKSIISLILAAALTACGSSSSQSGANALYNSADSAMAAGNYELAEQMLDTLKVKYPGEIDAQRKGMHLRSLVMERKTIAEIEQTDSLNVLYGYRADSLKNYFKFVDNPQLVEGYYVVKELADDNLFARTGLEGRVSPSGEFYMISSLNGPAKRHTSVSVTVDGVTATSATVAYDGERNYRSGSTEMITFTGAECDSVGRVLADHQGAPVKISYNGQSAYGVTLPLNDARSVALAWALAYNMRQARTMTLQREMLERKLMLARDQAARTSLDEDTAK